MTDRPPTSGPSQAGGEASLPLTRIVLFTSGVGYFQHDGQVHGRSVFHARFRAEAVNDLLKSLVVQDFDGGTVSTVNYDSREPVSEILKSCPVKLWNNTTLFELLAQLRGEPVEVAAPNPVTGTIVGVERRTHTNGEKNREERVVADYVYLLTDQGLRSFPLDRVQHVRLLNAALQAELTQALAVLASGHDAEKKSVSIAFDGQGARRARAAYLMATPVWKTTYRLVLDEQAPPYLQGWAIVENTTEQDWQDVRLSLVAGRPISFTMDLYEPLFVTRPHVKMVLPSIPRPPVHEQALSGKGTGRGVGGVLSDRVTGSSADILGELCGSLVDEAYEERLDPRRGVEAAAEGGKTGELFAYDITTPVTLRRRSSAMLPIIGQAVEGNKLSVYNKSIHPKHPLNAFRLKNTSALHLMQGPITVFDGGTYAGDARIEDLVAGGEHILSYALDLTVEVQWTASEAWTGQTQYAIRKGGLVVTQKTIREGAYTIHNRDKKPKPVLIEHAISPGFDLVEPSEPPERTRECYRFSASVEAGRAHTIRVREEHPDQFDVFLYDAKLNVLVGYMQTGAISPPVKKALEQVVAIRKRLDETAAGLKRLEQQIKDVTQEQARLRENLSHVPANSDLHARYLQKLDQQETEIEHLQTEKEAFRKTEETQKKELTDYLVGMSCIE